MSSLSLTAQNKQTAAADKHFAKFEFVDAIEDYQKLVDKGEADTYVYGQLAEANYNIFNTIEAERWYAKALESSQNPEMIYKYSQMLKANGKYAESNDEMRRFAEMRPGDDRAVAFRENPEYLPKILEKGKKFNIQNLDINSENSDFGGALNNSKFYFTSARNKLRRTYGWNDQPFLDVYVSVILTDGTYQEADLVEGDINTKYHEGTVTLSPDGNTMYFSRESYFDGEFEKDSITNTKYSVLQMFKATKDGDSWRNVEALHINSTNYNVSNPALSADGKTLYFHSNMPGGYGLSDIYKAPVNEDGTVGEPVNLGQKVNTEGQEKFPFVSNNGNIYFSSDGHLGLGMLDVFYTKEIDGKMAPIRNAGIPVNSNADDFAFYLDEESGEGYVSSNREGGKGSDDIYALKRLQPMCDVLITTTVVDANTREPLRGAMTTLYDGEGNKINSKPTDDLGVVEYMVECEKDVRIEATMDEYDSGQAMINGTRDEEQVVTIQLDPIEKLIVADRVVLDPIYFEFDKSNITSQAAFELDKLVQIMNKYPDMVIKATSHTDNRGSASYNEALSDRRAKTTVQYVVSKGIDTSRISGVGMGENDPKVDCGSNCTDEEYQLNRRSEFIITSGGPGQE